MKKKIAIVVGTRPELIRFSSIINLLAKTKAVELTLVHTGQHYSEDMNDIFFNDLNLPNPSVNLSVGKYEPNRQVGEIIIRMGKVITDRSLDMVCVWGDTNSSLGVAIAANKTKTRLCHVESGCRSHDFRMAEEYNRILIDHLSDLVFPLSLHDQNNLKQEKIHGRSVFHGDPLYDVFLQNQIKAKACESETLDKIKDCSILMTLHRAENVDNPETLKRILEAIGKINSGTIAFPMHPRTSKMIKANGLTKVLEKPHIIVTRPLSYLELLKQLDRCNLVITDSGGLQKEAFFAKKYCITLRKSTEWFDTVRLKVNKIIDPTGNSIDRLPEIMKKVSSKQDYFEKMIDMPYGEGHATEKIVKTIIDETS